MGALPEGQPVVSMTAIPTSSSAQMGAEAIYTLACKQVDLDSMSYALRHKASTETSQQRKSEALKCLNVIELFRASRGRNKPEWMVVRTSLPVIPPELRPLVPLDGGRFATSDLNDLYRRVIIRNNRLKTTDRDQGTGGDPAQREAYVAGGCRLAVRQLAQVQRREDRCRTVR